MASAAQRIIYRTLKENALCYRDFVTSAPHLTVHLKKIRGTDFRPGRMLEQRGAPEARIDRQRNASKARQARDTAGRFLSQESYFTRDEGAGRHITAEAAQVALPWRDESLPRRLRWDCGRVKQHHPPPRARPDWYALVSAGAPSLLGRLGHSPHRVCSLAERDQHGWWPRAAAGRGASPA